MLFLFLFLFFLRDMMYNQCANIFSTHATVYGSHSVMFVFIERKNIFLYVYPQLNFFFNLGLCVFIYPHLLNFPKNYFFQNLFCFSYFYRGRKCFFFNLCCSQRELLLFIERVASILYRAGFICFVDSLFSEYVFCLLFVGVVNT